MTLEVSRLGFSAGPDASISNINLEADAGEFLLVETSILALGSALLHALAGLNQGLPGSVLLNGRDLMDPGNQKKALDNRQCIALVYRDHGLVSILDVAENIALPLGYHQPLSQEELARAVQEIADQLEIGPLLNRSVESLNEHESRLVDLARGLIRKPRLLLIDGLLEGMGNHMQQRLVNVIDRHRKATNMIVIMTVRSSAVCPVCDRLYRLTPDGLDLIEHRTNDG